MADQVFPLSPAAIATHESGGCPDPRYCECQGQWPYFPKLDMVFAEGKLVKREELGMFPAHWDDKKIAAWKSSMAPHASYQPHNRWPEPMHSFNAYKEEEVGDKPFHTHVDVPGEDTFVPKEGGAINEEVKFPGEKEVIEHVTVPLPDECEVVAEDDVVEITLRYRGKEERRQAKDAAADILNAMAVSTTL